MSRPAAAASPAPAAPQGAGARVMKWVGVVAALVSLALALVTFTRTFAELGERSRAIGELAAIAQTQREAADYPAAWATLRDALAKADEGGWLAKLSGRLDAQRSALRRQQEDLAMQWLRNVRLGEGQKFADVVDPLLPVLARGLVGAEPQRRADLNAHLGWGHFLKSRDTNRPSQVDPVRHYRQALADDPANPYAHANWAHWIVWKRGDPAAAREHFAAALAAGRASGYVRGLQFSALRNRPGEDADAEVVRLVLEMRRNNESIDPLWRNDLLAVYWRSVGRREAMARLAVVAPPAEQASALRAFSSGSDFDRGKLPLRDASLAWLLDEAGQRREALALWRSLLAMPQLSTVLRGLAEEGVRTPPPRR